jgi:ribosome-associated protein
MKQTDRVARASAIAEAAHEKKCQQLVALDVREVTSVADTFILMTGTSDRHARALADAVVEAVHRTGEKPLGVEGYDEAR